MTSSAEAQRRIAAARTRFLSPDDPEQRDDKTVSDTVFASWKRSMSAGVDSMTSQTQYCPDLDVTSRLARCAQPVIRRLSEETVGIPLSIALTDGRARIFSRTDNDRALGNLLDKVNLSPGFQYSERGVGTNGIGTVFESGQSVHIVGREHFREGLSSFSCAGAPIRDPFSGRIEGVLDISCLTESSSPLMHSLVRAATRDIEKNLFLDRNHHQQALFDTFLRLDARTHGAVFAVGGGVAMGNTRAQALFNPAEQATVQSHAQYMVLESGRRVDQIALPSGKVIRMRATKVPLGQDSAGGVVEVAVISEADPTSHENGAVQEQDIPSRVYTSGDSETATRARLPVAAISDYPSPLWKRAVDGIATALIQHNPLLVIGETGTGKFSLLTEIYHQLHPGGRSVAIDAVDLARGSHGGAEAALRTNTRPTLYIFRNIDELSTGGLERLDALLRAMSESDGPIYRAATVSDANLDSDRPFRRLLSHFQTTVTVPSLRHRTDDLPLIVSRALANVSDRRGVTVSPAAMRVISLYAWPRNIRELEEALSVALSNRPVGQIQPEDLPGFCHTRARRRLTVIEANERDVIVQALHDADGNRVHAAAALGIARSTLYRKLKSYGITTL